MKISSVIFVVQVLSAKSMKFESCNICSSAINKNNDSQVVCFFCSSAVININGNAVVSA